MSSGEVLAPGTGVSVLRCRGRLSRRGTVVRVRTPDGVTHDGVIVVCWDDDGSAAHVVPGTDIQVSGPV